MNPFQVPSRFNRLQIEITTACNLKCAGCQRTLGIQAKTWTNQNMKPQQFAHLLTVCPPAEVIILQGIGEPTLHPQLDQLITLAKASGKYGAISFNTNALVHELDFYRHLRELGLGHVSVSVDSLNPDIIDKVRAGTDINTLRRQLQGLMRSGLGITVSIVLSRHNLDELAALLNEFGQMGVGLVEIQPLIDYTAEHAVLTPAQVAQALTIINRAKQTFARTNFVQAAGMTPNGSKCRRPFRAGYVTVDGFLTPCCTTDDADQFGRVSLFEHDFATAWNASGTVRWFNTYLDDEPDICRGCSFNSAGARPPKPDHWRAMAQQARGAGRLDQAQIHLQRLADQEAFGPTLHEMGLLHFQQGRFAQAAPLLAAAWNLAPSGAVGNAWGAALINLGQAEQAVSVLQQALAQFPDFPLTYISLATALDRVGQTDRASGILLALANRARAGGNLHYLDQAIAQLLARPAPLAEMLTLAHTMRVTGDHGRALRVIDHLLAGHPDDPGLKLARAVALLPMIYDSAEEMAKVRADYTRAIGDFAACVAALPPAALRPALSQVGNAKPFLLGYQGENDRDLQRLYGHAIARIMHAGHPRYAQRPPMPLRTPGSPIRVGFAAAQWNIHSVSKLFGGWVRRLDRQHFRVFGYYLNSAPLDDWGSDLSRAFDVFRMPPAGDDPVAAWADLISSDQLDVLIYPELGMEATAIRLACLHLAPHQGFSWGHPVASGLPSIDFFLSSDLMEPANGADHYDEELVRLPGLSIHYLPLPKERTPLSRERLGIDPDRPLFLNCQSLFKYRPQDDHLLADLAAAVPQAQFLFLGDPGAELTQRFARRLRRALESKGLADQGRLIFVPQVAPSAFPALLGLADVYLDSLSWSGGNTTLEAVTEGIPVVTLGGPMMRGRHSMAILTYLGLDELIANDKADYVAKAARLATDPTYRTEMAARVRAAAPGLFGDDAPVRALEAYLIKRVD